jgi:hypothetical protein
MGAHQDRGIGGRCHSASRGPFAQEKPIFEAETDVQARIPSVPLWLRPGRSLAWTFRGRLPAEKPLNDSDLQHTPMMAQYVYEAALTICTSRRIQHRCLILYADLAGVFLQYNQMAFSEF